MSKLLTIAIFSSIVIYGCSNKDGNTNGSTKEQNTSNQVFNKIFWAPAVESGGSTYYPAYYFFYSQDSCYIRYGGNLNGFKKAYTINESGVIIKFGEEKGDVKHQLLGGKVLMNDNRSYFEVESFATAFQSNK